MSIKKLTYFVIFVCSTILHKQVFSQHYSKLSPVLELATNKKSSAIAVRVCTNNMHKTEEWLLQNGFVITSKNTEHHFFTLASVSQKQINTLQHCTDITFIDVTNRTAYTERVYDSLDLSVNDIARVHAYYPQYTAEGLTVSVKEQPFDTSDIDFKGRIVYFPFKNTTPSLHATWMTTMIAGAGNTHTRGKGAAWKASIASSSYDTLMPDDVNLLRNMNVSVQSHSYGVGQIENYYGIESRAYDLHCRQNPNIVHIFSSGNKGNQTSNHGQYAQIQGVANTTGQFKMSKNTLCVGATNLQQQTVALSSRGPAYDGRVKPELVAFGSGGTSDAAAIASGIALLVQNVYKKMHANYLPPSALVKAVMINGATDVGRPNVDFESGFGSLNAWQAVQTVLENRFFYDSVANKQARQYNIQVPANTHQMKITLTWNDLPASVNATQALVNDLDMKLQNQASRETWLPWVLSSYPHIDSLKKTAHRATDHLNNVEQITLLEPTEGNYTITVHGYNVTSGQQPFSIAYQVEPKTFTWTYPLSHSTLTANNKMQIRWRWTLPNDTLVAYYKALPNDWVAIDTISAAQQFCDWTPPATNTATLLSLQSKNNTWVSDTFTVSTPLQHHTALNCTDEAVLQWDKVPAASQYEVYWLKNNFLEHYKTISDTMCILNAVDKKAVYYSVIPIFENLTGARAYTTNYATQGVECYVKSFLPQQYSAREIWFDVELASLYRLQSVQLQHYNKPNSNNVSTIQPVTEPIFSLHDASPLPDRNLYFLQFERNDGQLFYSDTIEVFYIAPEQIFVFPNPAKAGEYTQLLDGTEKSVSIDVFNIYGQLLYSYQTSEGFLKELPLHNLESGIYWLYIKTSEGYTVTRKLAVY